MNEHKLFMNQLTILNFIIIVTTLLRPSLASAIFSGSNPTMTSWVLLRPSLSLRLSNKASGFFPGSNTRPSPSSLIFQYCHAPQYPSSTRSRCSLSTNDFLEHHDVLESKLRQLALLNGGKSINPRRWEIIFIWTGSTKKIEYVFIDLRHDIHITHHWYDHFFSCWWNLSKPINVVAQDKCPIYCMVSIIMAVTMWHCHWDPQIKPLYNKS